MERGSRIVAFAAFAAASCAVLALLCSDLRPRPVYDFLVADEQVPALPVTAGAGVEISLDLPARTPSVLLLPTVVRSPDHPLEVELRDDATGRVLLSTAVRRSGPARLSLDHALAGVHRVDLFLRSEAKRRRQAPLVVWSAAAPGYEARVRVGGAPLAQRTELPGTGPLLRWIHPWPTRWLLALWLPVALAFAWAAPRPRRHLAFLVLLGAAAAATSGLLWEAHYTRFFQHFDADEYGRAARTLADWIASPPARDAARSWLRDYPHASTALVPALLAPALLVGIPLPFAYLELSALASFASLLLFHRLLTARDGLSPAASLGLAAVFGTHLLVLRAFARPIADAAGLLLTVALFAALEARRARRGRGPLFALSALALLLPLARPQGWGYWPFLAGALLAVDVWREGRRPRAAELLRVQVAVFAAPLLLLAGLYAGFDWRHNVALMFAKAAHFRSSNVMALFAPSVVGTVQLLPLLWPWHRGPRRDPTARLWAAWLLYYVALLVAVRAPFWMRHFLPVVPAVVALAAAGWTRLEPRRRRAAAALLAVTAALNLAATIYLIFSVLSPPLAVELLISSA